MTICPCCNDILLRSIYHKKIIWFCLSCRQQMPNISMASPITQEDLRITNISQENSSEFLSVNHANLQQQDTLVHDLPLLKSFIIRGKLRLYIVELIINHLSKLVVNAAYKADLFESIDKLSLKNKLKSKQDEAACLDDGELILNGIIYSFLIGDVSIIEHHCLNKLKQSYISFGTPFDNIANFIETLKNRTIFLVNQIAAKDLESSFEKYYSAYSSLISELATYFEVTGIFLTSN